MPLFNRNSVSNREINLQSDVYRRVLQRCRLILLKDLDVGEVLEALCEEECLSKEEKDEIISQPSRQQRVAVLLDRLEGRGQKAFDNFMETLKKHYRHLHSVLEESVRNIDSMEHDDSEMERVFLTGDSIFKLLKAKQNVTNQVEEPSYIECFSITKEITPTTTKTDHIKYLSNDSFANGSAVDTADGDEDSYMATLASNLRFTPVKVSDIPSFVKQPSKSLLNLCSVVYVIDKDQSSQNVVTPGRSVSSVSRKKGSKQPEGKMYSSSSKQNRKTEPPPVPQKPIDLPLLSNGFKPPTLKNRISLKKGKCSPPVVTDNVPPLNSKESKITTKPLPTVVKGTELPAANNDDSDSDDDALPPLPPRLDKLPSSPLDLPKRPLSSVSEESSTPKEFSPPPNDTSLNSEIVVVDVHSSANLQNEDVPKSGDEISETASSEELVCGEDGATVADIVKAFESKSPTSREPPVLRCVSKCDSEKSNNSKSSRENSDNLIDDSFELRNSENFEFLENDTLSNKTSLFTDNSTLTYADQDIGEENDAGNKEEIATKVEAESLGSEDELDIYEPVGKQLLTQSEQNLLDLEVNVSASDSDEMDNLGNPVDTDSTKDSGIDARHSTSAQSSINKSSDLESRPHDNGKSANGSRSSVVDDKRSISSESTISTFSDYEDIESVINRVPPSCSSGRSYQHYLDPKSYAHNMEVPFRLPEIIKDDSNGKIAVAAGELLLADRHEALNVESFSKNMTEPTSQESLDSNGEGNSSMEVFSKPNGDAVDESNYLNSRTAYQQTRICIDKMGRILYVPSKHLKCHGDPTGEPWFYPIPITPRQATLFLSQEKLEGCFVIYKPSSINNNNSCPYQLSVCRESGQVVHYGITEGIHGDVAIIGHSLSFMSIAELVKYFQSNKSQLVTRLRRPLQQARMPATPGVHYPSKWEITRSQLQLNGQIIGKGRYGVICGGNYQHRSIAVKILQHGEWNNSMTTSTDDFLDEALILMDTKHEHIVRFIGISCSYWPHYILLEYYQKGNLRDCLRNGDIPPEHIDLLFDLCIQVTSALTYLNSQRYIVHRDICAKNFLLTSDQCVKLSNFGRARKVVDDTCHCDSSENISVKWAAPEVMTSCMYSTKSDIWSLGIVFWEVFSYGQPPYVTLTGEQTALYIIDGGILEKPPGCSPDIYSIMKSCWQFIPSHRPTACILAERLASKSSIYYGPLQIRPKSTHSIEEKLQLPLPSKHSSGNKVGGTSPLPPIPPPMNKSTTPAGSGASNHSTTPITPNKSATLASPYTSNNRSRQTVYASRMEEYTREYMESSLRDQHVEQGVLHGSTSESSITNALHGTNSKDDITRSHKIRKSLRKVLQVKTTKRKSSSRSDDKGTGSERNSYSYNNW